MKIFCMILCGILSWPLVAGDDVIFKDGFNLTGAQIVCPTATPLAEMTNGFGNVFYTASDAIDEPGVTKYFTVNLSNDEWYFMQAVQDQEVYLLRPVITLYTADGSDMLAQNVDQSFSYSADFNYRAISTGLHCLAVEDYSSFSNGVPQGGNDYGFIVAAVPIFFDDYDGFNLDQEPNNSTASAQTGLSVSGDGFSGNSITDIVGDFTDQNDLDVFQLTTVNLAETLVIDVAPGGTAGYGGSVVPDAVELIAADGISVLAQITPNLDNRFIQLPVNDNTDYFLRTVSPAAPLGSNPFYSVSWRTSEQANQFELDDVGNNTAAGAELAIASQQPSPTFGAIYFIAGNLSGPADVDFWEFDVENNNELVLSCSSSFIGSGVQDATVSVFENPMDSALQTETEVQSTGIIWGKQSQATMPPVDLSLDVNHYLKIEANQFSSVVLGRHYACGVFVIPWLKATHDWHWLSCAEQGKSNAKKPQPILWFLFVINFGFTMRFAIL